MDTAGAEPADPAVGSDPSATGTDSPWLGVPSIPPAGDRARPPADVPSVPVPGLDPVAPVRLAPVAGAHAPPRAPDLPPSGDRMAVAPVVPLGALSPPDDAPGPVDGAVGFPPGVADKLQAYVYLLVDPRTGRPFYVGRGRDDRCYRHVRAARSGAGPGVGDGTGADGTGADGAEAEVFPVLDRIRDAESAGREVRVDILSYGMKGSEASLVERATREALGLQAPDAPPGQRRRAVELGAHLAKRAKLKRPHQVVLLRVGATGADPSYEVARHGWRIGRRWTDPGSPRAPHWAVIVVGDLVAAVHRIERWVPTGGGDGGGDGSGEVGGDVAGTARPGRYSFVGVADPELEDRYRGRSVAGYFGPGAPAPVTYVWCGPHWVNSAR